MERKVCLIAGGMSHWGVRQASQRDMFQEAAKACFDDNPMVTNKDIDGLLVASAYTERCSFQTHLAPLVAEYIGVKPKNICARVELLCASGSSAIILATGLIKAGMADVVMIIGGEKLYVPQKWEVFYSELASVDHDWDGAQGLGLPPPAFAMVAQQHMKKYGTRKEQLALVSIKNRRNGAQNPKAQFQQEIDMDIAMNAKNIVPPLTLFDCCPITDGAAAVILASEERARDLTDKPLVYVLGTGQATLNNMSANMPSWTTWEALKIAGQQAYKAAGVGPDDIDVAQTHDCFTISEIIEYEDLGFCKKGEGGAFIEAGESDFGGKIPINTDGGLLSCGHPFGGTGVRQAIEILKQLRGDARRQVEGAKIGLSHNLSGFIAAHTVLIYGRE
ncbi:MAG: thiolase family protein [Spirochaetes bacterium]|nr:thiolase family protein [Deltaproteobacteria bacterium]RKY00928.1 MAG: thiolase family protein [Spirochaetota bacterium]RLA89271.1 MAG: thiolase family protein [Deltaproteobacteria bacterium]